MIIKKVDPKIAEIRKLTNYLNERTKEYDEGYPTITDEEWDKKWFELKEKEKEYGVRMVDSPTQTIDYRVVSKLEKVRHNHKMLSLDKTKDWNEFLNYFSHLNSSKNVVGMLKLDGLTCSLRYVNGTLKNAETRGNGDIGENILHNAYAIDSIPNRINHYGELVIDGEIICTYNDFKSFEKEYKNPRNFASGSVRLLDAKECSRRKLTFVAWNVIKGLEGNSFIDHLSRLEDLGFSVTPWTSSFNLNAKEFLINKAEELGYPIDGLVGRFDDVAYGRSLGETGHHARAAYAFKFYDETAETKLLNITYDIGRTGVLTPVAVFEPIELEGTLVERASLHNLSVMREVLHGNGWKGQIVEIFKANQIIPQIKSAEEDDERTKEYFEPLMICPICGEPTIEVESDSGTITLECTNPECDGKIINKINHFAGKSGMDIKGLSKATLEKLIDWDWIERASDLYNLTDKRTDWIKKPGFGKMSVDKLLMAIEDSKNCELDKFICALGIPLIGRTASKDLAKEFKTWDNFIAAVNDEKYHFFNLNNFGNEAEYTLKKFNYGEAIKLAKIMNFKIEEEKEEITKGTMDKLTFVITGSLTHYKNRTELQDIIENSGGKVTSSVSKNTNYLINNDATSGSSKNVKAQSLGIPIITEEEFIKKFL